MAWRTREVDNVRDNRAAGDVVFVGADIIAKLSAETSLDRSLRLGINALLSCELLGKAQPPMFPPPSEPLLSPVYQ